MNAKLAAHSIMLFARANMGNWAALEAFALTVLKQQGQKQLEVMVATANGEMVDAGVNPSDVSYNLAITHVVEAVKRKFE